MSDTLPPFLATDPDVYEHFMGRWSARWRIRSSNSLASNRAPPY